MAFEVKDWRNADSATGGGDESTPLSAAALEDMEQRLSDYIGADEAWIAPSLGANWSNWGGAQLPARYKKTRSGLVFIQGVVKSSVGTDTSTIFTLPAGYRPAGGQLLFVTTLNSAMGAIVVETTGVVKVSVGTGTTGPVSLNLPCFPAEA